jgi:hypothetical protein
MVKHSRRQSMKRGRNRSRGRSMKRSRRGGALDANGNEIQEEVISSNGNGMPEKVISEEVISSNGNGTPEEEGSFFDNLIGTAKDKADQGVNTIEDGIGNVTDTIEAKTAETSKGLMDSFKGFFNSDDDDDAAVPNANSNPNNIAPATKGGRRRTRSKSMKMRGGLNPAFGYNAAPVMNSNTAEPTYMMEYTGGKRRRRTCKKRRKCCKKSCRKHHRHHYKR